MVTQKLAGFSRDAVLYGLGDAVGRLVGLVMFPVLSRIFVPADYGAIDLLTVSVAFVAQFVQMGVPSGLQRYFFRTEGDERRVLIASSVVAVVLFATVAALVVHAFARPLASFVSEDIEGITEGIRWLAIALPFLVATDQFLLLLRLQSRAVLFSVVNVAKIVVQPVLTAWMVVGLGLGLEGVFIAHAATAVVTAVIALPLIHDALRRAPDAAVATRLVRFGLPGQPAILIVQAMQLLPRYVLAAFAPLSAVGLFGVGMRVAAVQRVFIHAFARAWNPFAFANEGASDEKRLYEIALRGAITLVTWLSLVLSLFAPELLRLLAPSEYGAAAWLVPGIALHFAVDGLTPIFGTILYTRGAVKWTSYASALRLVVFLVLSFALVPRHSVQGLIAALLVSVVSQLVTYVVVSRRRFPIEFPWSRAGLVLLIDAAVYAAATAWSGPLLADLVVKSVLAAATLAGSIAILLEPDDRRRLAARVATIRRRPAG